MDTAKLTKQFIGFNRSVFDKSFNSIAMLQEQTEKIFNTSLGRFFPIPEEGRKVMEEWLKSYKTGCNDFKKAVDKNFEKMDFESNGANKAMEQKLTQVHKNIEAMGTRLATLEKRNWPQEIANSILKKKTLPAKEDLEPLKKALNQIEKGMPAASSLEKIKKAVEQLEKKMDGLQEEITRISGIIAALPMKLNPLSAAPEKVAKSTSPSVIEQPEQPI
jgi:polyhydroxyalkanoate synthesis regulator phasin